MVETGRGAALPEMLARFLGEAVMAAVHDDDVTEIYVNPDGALWLQSHSRGRCRTGQALESARVEQFLNAVASSLRLTVTTDRPALQAELPQRIFRGARLQGLLPPVVSRPSFALRKPPARIFGLESYVEAGALSPPYRDALRFAVREHWNILVCGATHSGKTTFCNALIHEMVTQHPAERFVLLEDTPELQCAAPDSIALKTAPPALELEDLVKLTLRLNPDRIIVGEVRDQAALHLLDAWATGHPGGCATLHASSPEGALLRLDRLARRANVPSQVELIAEAVDLIVMIRSTPAGRRVTDIARTAGVDSHGAVIVNHLSTRSAAKEDT